MTNTNSYDKVLCNVVSSALIKQVGEDIEIQTRVSRVKMPAALSQHIKLCRYKIFNIV